MIRCKGIFHRINTRNCERRRIKSCSARYLTFTLLLHVLWTLQSDSFDITAVYENLSACKMSEIQFRLLCLLQCFLYVARMSLAAVFWFYGKVDMNIISNISKILFRFLDKQFWISAMAGGEGVPEDANVNSNIVLANANVNS